MKSVANSLYLILVVFFSLLGCDDKKESPTKSGLDLKGFQIIRTDGETTGQQVYSPNDYHIQGTLRILDEVGAGNYPPDVTLVTSVRCWDNRDQDTKNGVLTLDSEMPFTKPVPFYKILPEKVLFRPKDISVDSMSCSIDLSAKDSQGNQYVLKKALSGVLVGTEARANADLFWGQQQELNRIPGLSVVNKDQWNRYSLRFSKMETLSAYKLMCERFEIEDSSISTVSYFDFEWIDLDTMIDLGARSDEDQICRILTYDDSGFRASVSQYFVFQQYEVEFPKSIQILRHAGTDHEEIMNSDDFVVKNRFDISDVFSANTYPEHLELVATASCPVYGSEQMLNTSKTMAFSGPVSIYSLLPEQVLFQKYDKSSDSLVCTVEIKVLNARSPGTSVSYKIQGTFHDTYGARVVEIRKDNVSLPGPNQGELATVMKSDFYKHSLTADNQKRFSSYSLVCETFSLTEPTTPSDYFDLKRMDFSKVLYRNGSSDNLSAIQSTPKQLCRFLVFDKNIVVGYSYYFHLIQELADPVVSIDFSQSSAHLGDRLPDGFNTNYSQLVKLADVVITNPNPIPMYISARVDQPMVRLQWHNFELTNPGILTSGVGEVASLIYHAHPKVQSADGKSWSGSSPNNIVIEPNGSYRIEYYMQNYQQCAFRDGQKMGLYYEIASPEIHAYLSNDPNIPENTFSDGRIIWSMTPGALTQKRFIYSSILYEQTYGKTYQTTEFSRHELDLCGWGKAVLDFR